MAAVEHITIDGIAVSWYCTSCLRELGAEDATGVDDPLGQPCDACPHCGSDAIAWEPWSGQVKDGRYLPDGSDGLPAVEWRNAEPWGD
ncbi:MULTISPECIES: hypothetical protein [Microbacterium]|uniref:Uncharacterized protein n=1 Tax=Microbacterium hominis TaxID=162426 RepID=A0A2K9DM71_9MICO|nr:MULTISPECIES: hypothetical protein [Microbacterium]AUG29458.1 hypothetical protein CXR34_08260 [Microbacterium hominis]EPD84156.1 hypothetical protein HMPREF1529_02196 [Microbacterium sp. oral taxon 186 str. F0373]